MWLREEVREEMLRREGLLVDLVDFGFGVVVVGGSVEWFEVVPLGRVGNWV